MIRDDVEFRVVCRLLYVLLHRGVSRRALVITSWKRASFHKFLPVFSPTMSVIDSNVGLRSEQVKTKKLRSISALEKSGFFNF